MSRYARRMLSAVDRTLNDAYDIDFSQKDFIFRKKLLQKFTDRGSRNFITYAERAYKGVMKSKTIKSQVKNSVEKLEKIIAVKRKKIESTTVNISKKMK